MPHHITRRSNHRFPVFSCGEDYQSYLSLLSNFCSQYQVTLWAYCLIANHVRLVTVPEHADGLRGAPGTTHRPYTRRVNFRVGWRSLLLQGCFAPFVMDYPHTLAMLLRTFSELNLFAATPASVKTGYGRQKG